MTGSEGDGAGGVGRQRPGPDGRHDDLDPRELGRLDVTIPDDASELDLDRQVWLTEVAGPPSGEAPTGIPFDTWPERRARQRRRLAITAGVVLISMVVVALSGAVGAWIVGPTAARMPAPLATGVPDDGQVGGLLPAEAVLENGEAQQKAQSIRPAVLAVVPPSCPECTELLSSLAPRVGTFGVPLFAIGGAGQVDQLDQLADQVASSGSSRLVTLTGPKQILASTYGGATPTLVVVGADGVVADVITDPAPNVTVEADLVELSPST